MSEVLEVLNELEKEYESMTINKDNQNYRCLMISYNELKEIREELINYYNILAHLRVQGYAINYINNVIIGDSEVAKENRKIVEIIKDFK